MPEAKAKKAPPEETVAWENPLIPNKKLLALYQSMVELRCLEEHVAGMRPRSKLLQTTARGEEGCRASTTLDLKRGDLTSDGYRSTSASEGTVPGQLPVMANPVNRLHLAMGAALGLKTARKGALLTAYVSCDELKLAEWKPLLRFAAEHALPIILVVLPESPETKPAIKPGQLSLASSKQGVPGIPVDAGDPVALYRVAQESTLRARAGGGPVLMECIPFRVAGSKAVPGDPIATMQEFLLHRKIVDDAWLERVESRFMAHLKASGR